MICYDIWRYFMELIGTHSVGYKKLLHIVWREFNKVLNGTDQNSKRFRPLRFHTWRLFANLTIRLMHV